MFTEAEIEGMWAQLPGLASEFANIVVVSTLVNALNQWLRGPIGGRKVSDFDIIKLSSLDLAHAAVKLLAEVSGKPAAEWCRRLWAVGAAPGVGVDPQ